MPAVDVPSVDVSGVAVPAVAVVGGGITGLAAAWELSRSGVRVVVLEASETVGGKLRSAAVAGHHVDVGAESMLARRPEGLELISQAGLSAAVVHPRPAPAAIYSRGRLWPLPPRTLMGVPSTPASTLGILSSDEVARIAKERPGAPLVDDVSVGEFVAERVGAAVVDRLVEPLLAGVYAGHAGRLSLRATVPALWQAAATGTSVVSAALAATAVRPTSTVSPTTSTVSPTTSTASPTTSTATPTNPAAGAQDATARASRLEGDRAARPALDPTAHGAVVPERPVFAGYLGGMGALAADLANALRAAGVDIRTRSTVRELARTPGGWRLTVGSTTAPQAVDVTGVVLAVPAAPAARLLRGVVAGAAHDVAAIDYASVAIITLALPRAAAGAAALTRSGFLVPPSEPLTIKAATFSSTKWAWVDALDPDLVLVRTSVGRAGETAMLQREDGELVETAMTDLRAVLGAYLPGPVDADVQRWGGGLPQYAVGHVERVARIASAVSREPGLALAGAAYEGVGIPACIASGRRAAREVLAQVGAARPALRE